MRCFYRLLRRPYPLWILIQQRTSAQSDLTEETTSGGHIHCPQMLLISRPHPVSLGKQKFPKFPSLSSASGGLFHRAVPKSPNCWDDGYGSLSNLPLLSRLFGFLSNFLQSVLNLNGNIQSCPECSKEE